MTPLPALPDDRIADLELCCRYESDVAAQALTDLSSTRTALQRVREAGQAYFAAKDAWKAAPVAYDSSAMNGDHPLYTACDAAEEVLRALTSSETDQ